MNLIENNSQKIIALCKKNMALQCLKSWFMDLQMIIEHKICGEKINYYICENGN